jgi:hypothetical protein
MAKLVKAFKGLKLPDLAMLAGGIAVMSLAIWGLSAALYGLAAAGTVAMPAAPVLWGLAAAVAALGFAIGYTLQGAAAFMNVFKETPATVEQIEATSSMVFALSKLGEFDYGEVAEDVKDISNAMSGVTVTSANAIAEVLKAMAEASPRAIAARMQALNVQQGTTGTTTRTGTTTTTAAPSEFTIYLEIDGEQFDTKILSVVGAAT